MNETPAKQLRAAMVNAAIQRSEVALAVDAKAEVVDGRIEYSTCYPRRPDSRKQEPLRGILRLLHGQDAREILGKQP